MISAIQNVEGVAYVDVDAFGGIPEKKADSNGTRQLLTLRHRRGAVASAVKRDALNRPLPNAVDVNLADFEKGSLRPAQLAIFTSAVPDTVILNQIK